MKTVSFSCFHDRHNAWWFAAGWQELHTFTRKRGHETADEVNAAALPWLRAHAREDNWFLHVQYWDIHTPYRISREWADRFKDDPPPDWPDQEAIDRHQRIYGPKTALDLFTFRDKSPTPVMPDAVRTTADFKKLIDGYDGAILYADHHVGQLFDVLDEAGVLEETAVIITGDHGDSFGEHGRYTDHGIADEPVLLHDMTNDPHQEVNLAAERPEVVARLNTYLAEWRHEQMRKGAAPDPLERMVKVGPFLYCDPERFAERLRRTGRAEFAEDLIRRLSRFHPERFGT